MQIHMRWICNFLFNFLSTFLFKNFIIPDRIEKHRKDYCSVCAEMRLISKEQAELPRFGSIHPRAKKKLVKEWQAQDRTIDATVVRLQQLWSSRTWGYSHSRSFSWPHPTQEPQAGGDCLSEAGAPDICGPCGPAREGGSWLHTLSAGSGGGETSIRPLGKQHWVLPRYSDGHFKGRGWKSLSVQLGKAGGRGDPVGD